MTKCCSICRETKSLDDFYPRGKNAWRPSCKMCSAEQARQYAKGQRYQGPPTDTIPLDIRVASYRSVIDRMVRLGLMSEGTAEKSLERVSEMESQGAS